MESFELAVRAWVDAAVELFASDPDSHVEQTVGWRESRWEPVDDNQFALREHLALGFSRTFVEAIHALPSFGDVRTAAAADPVVEPQVDAVVGTVVARHRRTVEEFAASVLPRPILLNGAPTLATAETFEARWARLTDFLTADTVEMTAFCPLAGVVVESPPVTLEEGLVLDLMDAVETDVGLRFGIIPCPFMHLPFTTLERSKRFCLRYCYRLPKLVGDGTSDTDAAEAQNVFDRLDRIVADFLDAIALVGPGRYGVLGVIEHQSVQLYGYGTTWRAIAEQQLLRFGDRNW